MSKKLPKEQILNLYEQGKTGKEITIELKLTNLNSVYNFLKANTLIRTRREAFGITKEIEFEICEKYKNGCNAKRIAKYLKFDPAVIFKTLEIYNIPKNKNYNGSKIYSCDENYFETIDSKDKAYFLGLIISDGCNMNNWLQISLQEEDKLILEKFKKYIEYTGILNFKNNTKRKNKKNAYELKITSKKICTDLSNLGVIPSKTHCTYFPDISEEFHSHFIRGVFDGDGCIYVQENGIKIFSIIGNEILIEKIQSILMINCNLNRTKFQIRNKNSPNIKTVVYGGNKQIRRIYEYLYNNCEDLYLERKKEKFNKKLEKEIISKSGYKHIRVTPSKKFKVEFFKVYLGIFNTLEEAILIRNNYLLTKSFKIVN